MHFEKIEGFKRGSFVTFLLDMSVLSTDMSENDSFFMKLILIMYLCFVSDYLTSVFYIVV